MIPYWKKKKSDNGYIYSCDMIRINLYLKEDGLKSLSNYFSDVNRFDVTIYPINLNNYKYRNMLTIDYGLSTMTIGLCFNSSSSKDMLKGFAEFNPNKCYCRQFLEDVSFLLKHCWKSELVRWDLAIDIPIKRSLLYLPKDQRMYGMHKLSNEDLTEYLGRRSNVGYVKLYNKTIEAQLDEDWSRLEITMSADMFESFKYIPSVYKRNYDEVVLSGELKQNDLVLIELLQQCNNPDLYLSRLSYHMRKKLEPYVNMSDALRCEFEPFYIDQLLNDVVSLCVK